MKILITLNILMAAAIAFVSISYFTSARKIVYVNTGDVFNTFQMTKETDKTIKTIEEKKQLIVDSLAGIIKRVQAGVIKLDEREFDFLKRDFIIKRKQFSEDITKLKQTSADKIWKQINQYIAD